MSYDVIIIGGGPGGYVAAIRAGQLGLKAACIEGRGSLGGTCLNVGCIPSKALLNFSEGYYHSKKMVENGMIQSSGELRPDLSKMMETKAKNVKELTGGIEFLLKKNKVDYIKGYAQFKDKNTVIAEGKEYTAKNFIIATGSSVSSLPFIKIDEEKIVSSTGALELKEIPKKMVVIGGGVIGLEMGTVYSNLGSQVEVVEYFDRILPPMDGEISKQFDKILKKKGFKINTSSKVTAVERKGKGVEVKYEDKKGNEVAIEADIALVAVGRKPNTDNLNPQATGVALDERGFVKVDLHTLKATDNVYAIGDVIGGAMLAHKAEEEGIAAVNKIAGKYGHVNYDVIPSVVYTHPEVAAVGKTEEELKSAGIKYKTGKFSFMANSRAKAIGDTDGLVKILADAETDKILGAHIIGPFAGEMIGEIVVGMEYSASAEDIALSCHAHPTFSEAIKEACLAVNKEAIHS